MMLPEFSPAELALIQSLLAHYQLEMLRALRSPAPKTNLTTQGRAQYQRDAELAERALAKLKQEIAA